MAYMYIKRTTRKKAGRNQAKYIVSLYRKYVLWWQALILFYIRVFCLNASARSQQRNGVQVQKYKRTAIMERLIAPAISKPSI